MIVDPLSDIELEPLLVSYFITIPSISHVRVPTFGHFALSSLFKVSLMHSLEVLIHELFGEDLTSCSHWRKDPCKYEVKQDYGCRKCDVFVEVFLFLALE